MTDERRGSINGPLGDHPQTLTNLIELRIAIQAAGAHVRAAFAAHQRAVVAALRPSACRGEGPDSDQR